MVNIIFHADPTEQVASLFGNSGTVYFLTVNVNGVTLGIVSDPANGLIGVQMGDTNPVFLMNPDLAYAVAAIVNRLEQLNKKAADAVSGITGELVSLLTSLAAQVAAREDRVAALLEAAASGNVRPIAWSRASMQVSIPVNYSPPSITLPPREPVGKRIIVLEEKKNQENQGQEQS